MHITFVKFIGGFLLLLLMASAVPINKDAQTLGNKAPNQTLLQTSKAETKRSKQKRKIDDTRKPNPKSVIALVLLTVALLGAMVMSSSFVALGGLLAIMLRGGFSLALIGSFVLGLIGAREAKREPDRWKIAFSTTVFLICTIALGAILATIVTVYLLLLFLFYLLL